MYNYYAKSIFFSYHHYESFVFESFVVLRTFSLLKHFVKNKSVNCVIASHFKFTLNNFTLFILFTYTSDYASDYVSKLFIFSTLNFDNDRQKSIQRSHNDQCIKLNIFNDIENPKHCSIDSSWPNLTFHLYWSIL